MKPHFVMVIDTRCCVGCSACVVGCKAENDVPEGGFRDWVVTETWGSFPNLRIQHRSERCNHCEKAPCIDNCPTGASFRAKDGTVQVDRDRCSGCKNCLSACPYDARYVHPDGFVDKCTFCDHIEGTTSCAEVCPTEAIVFGDANDPRSKVSKMLREANVEVLKPEAGTWPSVYFLS